MEKIIKELKKNKYLYIMAVPIIAYYVVFHYLSIFGIVIAFKDYSIGKGILAGEWVGLKYFKEFFNGMYFSRVLINTLLISLYELIFVFPAPIIFALLLNEVRNKKFKKIIQTVTYLPHFISLVVICGMIVNFFSTDGIITRLLMLFGGKNINYIGESRYFRTIFTATSAWQNFGWSSIVFLAALTGIDPQLYEAATIDGASRFKQTLHITIPGIMMTIITMFILKIGKVLSVGYEKVILLYSPATYDVADVISSYVYRVGLNNFRYSYSTAVGLFQSVVNITLVLLCNSISKKVTDSSLF